MNTPIWDFARTYVEKESARLHMPGHKGRGAIGCEAYDLTEITGADSLYDAAGIIAESEANASALFGCPTFYSAEGSSHCIRAMLALALPGGKGKVLAQRNAHKAFLNAAIALDFDIAWLYPESCAGLNACPVTPEQVEKAILQDRPDALYLTSPDYLGNLAPIAQIATICHAHDVLLLVDNAHGAYLHFLETPCHPMDLGADLCCDSAHKTLPVLTGGAYLHVTARFAGRAKDALALFGSTSPSYLIMESLDLCNPYLEGLPARFPEFLAQLHSLRLTLTATGYCLAGDEAMKITIRSKPYGYLGTELAAILENRGIVCEFADPDYLVLMPSPYNTSSELSLLASALCTITPRAPIADPMPSGIRAQRVMSPRKAYFSEWEELPVSSCEDRILASANVSCPPAIPIVMCGERIDRAVISLMQYYGIRTARVVK